MVIGEDKAKVANIVNDNIQHFRILYSNILRDCPQVVYKPQQGKLEVKHGTHTHTHLLLLSHLWAYVGDTTVYYVLYLHFIHDSLPVDQNGITC